MTDRKDGSTNRELEVPFTEQQLILLDRLRDEGRFGGSMEEICLNVFREYAEQLFGGDGRRGP